MDPNAAQNTAPVAPIEVNGQSAPAPQVDWFMIAAKVIRTMMDSLVNAYTEEKQRIAQK